MGMLGTHPGGVLAFATANGGKVYAPTLGTSAAQVIAANALRQSLIFTNPGTVTLYVAPMLNAVGQSLIVNAGALAGAFQLPAGATLILGGECQGAWQAFGASGGIPLTVMESNV
jgi:hypothetical protein